LKRCFWLLFFMTLSLTFLPGCVEITDWEPTAYETVNNFDGVYMTVNEETVSSTGLNSKISRYFEQDMPYGNAELIYD